MSINRVGIIGAGTMGNGIAQVCAANGIPVVLVDVAQPALERGLGAVRSNLERLVQKEKMSAADRDAALARIRCTTQYDDLKRLPLVIEAASIVMEIDEVLVAMIASGASSASSCLRIFTLMSGFSVAASITRSQSPRSS